MIIVSVLNNLSSARKIKVFARQVAEKEKGPLVRQEATN